LLRAEHDGGGQSWESVSIVELETAALDYGIPGVPPTHMLLFFFDDVLGPADPVPVPVPFAAG